MADYCSNCGAAAAGAAFCGSCGSSIGQAATNTATQGTGTSYGSAASSTNTAMWAHLGGVLAGFLVPLIIRNLDIARRDRYVREQATEALNFQLQWLIVNIGMFFVVSILTVVTFGLGAILYFLCFVPSLLILIFGIQGSMAATRGENFRYPMMMFRLVK